MQIKTSERRINQINKRLPEIANEFEQMKKNQGVVDKDLEKAIGPSFNACSLKGADYPIHFEF